MTNKKYDFLYNLENLDSIKQRKNDYYNATIKYQKQYGFDMGKGEHATWNNEADAFKHAYMQAHSRFFDGAIKSKAGAWLHERNGNKYLGQPSGEENMDLWNNAIGQEIGEEVAKELNGIRQNFSKEQIENWIAHKVMERLKAGKLITDPNDTRRYNKRQNNPTGGAAPIQTPTQHTFTPEGIGKMSPEEFNRNETAIMQQVKNGQIVQAGPQIILDEYTTPEGAEMIFTKEDLDNMSTKEFTKHEKTIWMQMKKIGIPNKNQLPKNTKTYSSEKAKNSYSNSKNGKWVTINGNHVFIED